MNKFFKISIPFLVLTFLFGTFAAGEASAQDILGQILRRMDQQNQSLTSLRASVTMVKQDANLGEAGIDTTRGKALYLPQKGKDALVRIDWTSPEESLAVVNKEYVIYRPRLGQVMRGSTDRAKGSAKANGALAFMNMSRDQLRANYDVAYLGEATVAGGVRTWHLRLTPKTATSYKLAELWIDPNGFPVQSKIIEKNNDTTTVLLSDLEKNITLNASSFKITFPKGTKIIKS